MRETIETVTLTAGQRVYSEDAIAHERYAAVQAHLYGHLDWTMTEALAGDVEHVSTAGLVKRIEQLRAMHARLDADGIGAADVERAIGRLTMVILARVPDLFA